MIAKVQVWIAAARLRTLPLSVSGILLGNGMAYIEGNFSVLIASVALLTTIAFQVLSNIANDYGDGIKGTDNAQRIGPVRMLQQGKLTATELKNGLRWGVCICLVLTTLLLFLALDIHNWKVWFSFFLLGVAAIIAAITYTVGKRAYGYYALGDLFVFIFFGIVSVMGSHYLQTQRLDFALLLPATSIGCFSSAVLNLNNMRDRENDRLSNKITLPILLGIKHAKTYHVLLIVIAFLSSVMFAQLKGFSTVGYGFIVLIIPFGSHLKTIFKITDPHHFDPELKTVALGTFTFSLVFVLSAIMQTL